MKVWTVNCEWFDAGAWSLGVFTSLGLIACAVNNHLNGADVRITSIEWDTSGCFCTISLNSFNSFPDIVGCIEIERVTLNEL